MSVLSKKAPKLLRTVGGKRHASDGDHEEPAAKRRQSPAARSLQDTQDIYAEPVTSDDELRAPTSKPKTAATNTTTSETTHELKLPQRKSARKEAGTQATSHATSQASAKKERVGKVKNGHEDNKENTTKVTPNSSSASAEGDLFQFGLEHASQRSNKSSKAKTFGSKSKTTNIHVQQTGNKGRKGPAIRVPGKNNKTVTKAKAPHDDESELSDISMMDTEELRETLGSQDPRDPELCQKDTKKRSKRNIEPTTSTLADDELNGLLKSTLEDEELRRTSRRSKPTVLYDQLGDWIKDRIPDSSQPESSAPEGDDLDNLKEYLKLLPEEEEEGSKCLICRAPVENEYYWDYWKGKDKTVKNQNTFCRAHRTKTAWEEYRSEGYPDIVWTALPHRIRKHRMELFKILNNDRPSGYRDRYEPIALTGKAAAVPSTRRKDLPEHVLNELESYALDDQSTYPGYYGPHGRRVITETVMRVLKNEIKNCSDAVVQGSGPATFVQAVLVPETAILLIMEDCRVDREEAEEIREKTFEVGMLLNEEIEDRVEAYEQSDNENEYGGS
jgi:hypothetical protein